MSKKGKKEINDHSTTYKWIIGILIGLLAESGFVIWLIISVRLSLNYDVVNTISLVSSGVSIALGFVAIIYAYHQTTQNRQINKEFKEKLDSIDYSNIEIANTIKNYQDTIISISDQINKIETDKLQESEPQTVQVIKELKEEIEEEKKAIEKKQKSYITYLSPAKAMAENPKYVSSLLKSIENLSVENAINNFAAATKLLQEKNNEIQKTMEQEN
jgi:gas vesicle protein